MQHNDDPNSPPLESGDENDIADDEINLLTLLTDTFGEEDENDTDFIDGSDEVCDADFEVADEEDVMFDVDYDENEVFALRKDIEDFFPNVSGNEVYNKFLGQLNEQDIPTLYDEDSNDDYNAIESAAYNNESPETETSPEKETDNQSRDEGGVDPQPPRRGRKRSLHGQIIKTPYAHIEPRAAFSSKPLFAIPVATDSIGMTVEQASTFTEQLREHYQLLASVLIHARRENFDQETVNVTAQRMIELKQRRNVALAEKKARYHHWYSLQSMNTAGPTTRSQKKPFICPPPPFGMSTVLNIDGIDLSEQFVRKVTLATSSEMARIEFVQENLIKPFGSIFKIQELLPDFTPQSEQNKIKLGRLKFTKAEDKLLALGLAKHGTSNWEVIRQELLPTKSTAQLVNRYKNMSSTRAPDEDNPIKLYKAGKKQPLSTEEMDQLLEAVKAHGQKWEFISKQYMSHRTGTFLKKSFQLHKFGGKKPKKSATTTSTEPKTTTSDKQPPLQHSMVNNQIIDNSKYDVINQQQLVFNQYLNPYSNAFSPINAPPTTLQPLHVLKPQAQSLYPGTDSLHNSHYNNENHNSHYTNDIHHNSHYPNDNHHNNSHFPTDNHHNTHFPNESHNSQIKPLTTIQSEPPLASKDEDNYLNANSQDGGALFESISQPAEEKDASIVFEEEDLDSDVDDEIEEEEMELVWTQEEDREILRASIDMGNLMNHLQIWEHLYNEKIITKDPASIGRRYEQLMRLFVASKR
ncbi:mybO [Acrasis kona]|uniref:MybO n=1 Tax=Acrasis kona TaxID=1008807 RepID=A0AAW2ZEB6_9EUKA